jgi:hypothetical protein
MFAHISGWQSQAITPPHLLASGKSGMPFRSKPISGLALTLIQIIGTASGNAKRPSAAPPCDGSGCPWSLQSDCRRAAGPADKTDTEQLSREHTDY